MLLSHQVHELCSRHVDDGEPACVTRCQDPESFTLSSKQRVPCLTDLSANMLSACGALFEQHLLILILSAIQLPDFHYQVEADCAAEDPVRLHVAPGASSWLTRGTCCFIAGCKGVQLCFICGVHTLRYARWAVYQLADGTTGFC